MNKTSEARNQKWFISIILICIGIISLLTILENTICVEFYCKGITAQYVNTALIVIILIMIRLLCSTKIKNKFKADIITIISILIIILFSFFISTFFGSRNTMIHSPNQQETIVVKEYSFLFSGHGEMYQQINPLFVKKIGDIDVDDGNCPFERGQYYIDWQDNQIVVHYGFDPSDTIDQFVEKTFELS